MGPGAALALPYVAEPDTLTVATITNVSTSVRLVVEAISGDTEDQWQTRSQVNEEDCH